MGSVWLETEIRSYAVGAWGHADVKNKIKLVERKALVGTVGIKSANLNATKGGRLTCAA